MSEDSFGDGESRRIPRTVVSWGLTAIIAAVWLAMELVGGGSENPRTLIEFGAKVNPLIGRGEYWRLFTAMFLHIGFQHLALNSFALLSYGRFAEMAYGHARFLAIYLVSGVSGAVFSYLMSRSLSAGASGAIFGVSGALVVFYAKNSSIASLGGRGQLGGLALILGTNAVIGWFNTGIDNWGHAGGLVAGVALAAWMAPRVEQIEEDGYPVGLRRHDSSVWSWLVVPLVLGILYAAVVLLPGR